MVIVEELQGLGLRVDAKKANKVLSKSALGEFVKFTSDNKVVTMFGDEDSMEMSDNRYFKYFDEEVLGKLSECILEGKLLIVTNYSSGEDSDECAVYTVIPGGVVVNWDHDGVIVLKKNKDAFDLAIELTERKKAKAIKAIENMSKFLKKQKITYIQNTEKQIKVKGEDKWKKI